jgi:hypothetical protein
MKLQQKLTVALGCSLVFLCSCASIGTNFSPKPDVLKLGQLKSSEYVQYFGKPEVVQTKVNADGHYEVAQYAFLQNNFGTVSGRVLLLEFKNGVLNGYGFLSSFDEDKSKADLAGIDQVRNGIGKSSQSDVLAILGQPGGKVYCPTTLKDFKDRCGKGTEIWGWFAAGKISIGFGMPGQTSVKTTDIYVVFDASGKVTDVQTEESAGKVTQ